MAEPWYSAFQKAFRTGAYIVAHVIVAVVLIGAVELVQELILKVGDPKLFDIVPLRYIFDGMDLGILLAFLVIGTLEAIDVFKER